MKNIAVAQTKRVKVNTCNGLNSVRVENKNTPSLTVVADNARLLTRRDWRLAKKLSRMQRRIDRKYAKLNDDMDVAGDLVMLSVREYKQAIKLAETLRASDKALLKAQKVEKEAKQARFEKAQLEVR